MLSRRSHYLALSENLTTRICPECHTKLGGGKREESHASIFFDTRSLLLDICILTCKNQRFSVFRLPPYTLLTEKITPCFAIFAPCLVEVLVEGFYPRSMLQGRAQWELSHCATLCILFPWHIMDSPHHAPILHPLFVMRRWNSKQRLANCWIL